MLIRRPFQRIVKRGVGEDMGQQIIKQPDGKYAVWSTGADSFVLIDATPEVIIESWVEEFRQNATRTVNETVRKLEAGEKPYAQFTLSWGDTLAMIKEVHGRDESLETLRQEASA